MCFDLILASDARNRLDPEVVEYDSGIALGSDRSIKASRDGLTDLRLQGASCLGQIGRLFSLKLEASDGAGDRVHVRADDARPEPAGFDEGGATAYERIQDGSASP